MRQYLIVLTTLFVLIGWTSTASARSDHRNSYNSKPHHSQKHYKQARKHSKKHYREDQRHAYRDNYYASAPHNYNYGFRTDNSYGYYNNQRFYQRSHHGQSYYANNNGYYFPNYGYINHGHRHNYRCPSWHRKSFVTGILLGTFLAYQ